jgi:ankyrin repeat protein
MNKKVVVVLLCVSTHCIGMRQLSYSKSDPEQKHVRYRRKPLSSDQSKYISALLGYVQDNKALNLKFQLQDKSDRVETNWLGHRFFIPGILPNLLRYKCSASLLYEAVNLCHERCAAFLLEHDAYPTIAIAGGNTSLHVAKSSSAVQLLMDRGACIDQKNDCGETPFFKCIKNSCLDRARILYDVGADVNACNKAGNTPLHYAAKYLKQDVIQFLLYRGANINCLNKLGETPYQIIHKRGGSVLKAFREWKKFFRIINSTISENRSLTIMSLLADDGKQLKNILAQNCSGYCSQDIAVAEKLFNQCGDEVWDILTFNSSLAHKNPLMLARFIYNRSWHRKLFLESLRSDNFGLAHHYLEINPYLLHTYEGEYDNDEGNALFAEKVISSCASDDQYQYLQKMMYSGFFDLDYCDELGNPLLSVVIQSAYGGTKYLDLLKAGARVNIQDNYGNTPLFYAVMLENKDMIAKLLLYGAVVNQGFGESFNLPDEMWTLMNDAYGKQTCAVCKTHDRDLSNIPCVNRHLGHFICNRCYKKRFGKCPMCQRSMGMFGL